MKGIIFRIAFRTFYVGNMKIRIDKRILNVLAIVLVSLISFRLEFWDSHQKFLFKIFSGVVAVRILASYFILKDYCLSWSKATGKSFLIKSFVYFVAFLISIVIFYNKIDLSILAGELFIYLFLINFTMYFYSYYINHRFGTKKSVAIYGVGENRLNIESELCKSGYYITCFIDEDKALQKRSIDGIKVVSLLQFKGLFKSEKVDLLVVVASLMEREQLKKIYEDLYSYAKEMKILPSLENILLDEPLSHQLKDITVEDLLARRPKDLDKDRIERFTKDKVILVTGAGGSIGSEICRKLVGHKAKKIILVDHSEFNLYAIEQDLIPLVGACNIDIITKIVDVKDRDSIERIFEEYTPQIILHAAAYKHVPMLEHNIRAGIDNNIIGTKNCIDLAVKYGAEEFVLISSDKAVRPTNVMGATKRVCELYAQNKLSETTKIVTVRFGNVLGSSGSVIPKFREQIKSGGPITITHPEINRYFMLIPEACELVLQAAAIGSAKEVFVLDMGEPVKIVDLAKKMIKISGAEGIELEYTGLRPGEKLYEELLMEEDNVKTDYESIFIGPPTRYDILSLELNISRLCNSLNDNQRISILKEIVPEFNHNKF